MSRLLTTLCLAALLCVVSATVSITPSRRVASSTTTSTTPSPSPTPPPKPVDKNYFLNDTEDATRRCLHLKGSFALKFTYVAANNKNVTKYVDFTNKTQTDSTSMCNSTALVANLNITVMDYYLAFDIVGNSTSNKWNVTQTEISFRFNGTEFPGYSGKPLTNENVMVVSDRALLQDTDLKANQSYLCNANRTIGGFPPIVQADLSVQLSLKDLQVQAFYFKNVTTGAFDNVKECLQDNNGNKVVPIAVGAALAGLVIVVLIAYLIGRLRNRKKSSYEALS